MVLLLFFAAEFRYHKISVCFSPGDFKEVAPRLRKKEAILTAPVDQEEGDDEAESEKQIFMCPKEGCTRGFQRHSSLEKHLTFGKCTKSVERETLIDKAMIKYAATLQEGESALPTISATISTAADRSVAPPEGWALRKTKKAYRFNEEQRRYLEARFTIGQESGMKLDSEVVAKDPVGNAYSGYPSF